MSNTWIDRIDALAGAAIDRKGLKVTLVTDYGTKSVIYDSDAPDGGTAKPSFLLPDYQVLVTDRAGDIITEYGEPQKLNLMKAGILYGSLAVAAIITIKGIKGFVT